MKEGLLQNQWARDVVGAPTTQVLCQYLLVWRLLANVTLDPIQSDRFVWKWSADGKYSASSTYRAFFAGATTLPGAVELWKTKAPGKVRFFFWLAMHRRLWTAERRKRHGLQDHDDYIMCGQEPETASHLFLQRVLARELWLKLLYPVGLDSLLPQHDDEIVDWWLRQRMELQAEARAVFDSLLMLASWMLWKERNNRTFRDATSTVHELFRAIVTEGVLWVQAGYKNLSTVSLVWSQNLSSV